MEERRIRTWVEEFLAYCRVNGRAEATIVYHRSCLKRFAKWCRTRNVETIEQVDRKLIRDYWGFLLDNYKGATSAARSVRAFFNWLDAEGEKTDNPVSKAGFPKKQQETIQPLTPEEIQRLLEAARRGRNGRRDSALILWLYDTGLRVSEAARLRIRDVDFNHGQATVRRKGGKTGTVVFSYRTARAVRTYLRKDRAGANEYEELFVTDEGLPLDRFNIRSILQRAAKRAGMEPSKVTPHKLRHSFAVAFLRNGGSALHLQAMLGHSTLDMTKRYVAFSGRDFREAHKRYSPVLNMRNANDEDDW